jgi:hypothetical protein
VKIRNSGFLPRLNKKQNVEIDSSISGRGQGKYVKYVSFPWPPLEAVLSIFNLSFLLKTISEKELIKAKKLSSVQITSILNLSMLKRSVWQFSRS